MRLGGGGAVVTLTAVSEGLLVGRYDPADPQPARLSLLRGGSAGDPGVEQVVPLTASSGYAPVARWVAIADVGADVVALGGAPGGAHANTRWTVWRGTASAGLTEQPQTFETFGHQEAGGMVGVAALAPPWGPQLVGTWANAAGLGSDLAVWRPVGSRWVRSVVVQSALHATPTSIPTPEGVAAAGPVGVVAGWTTELTREVLNVPTVWLLDPHERGSRRTPLPLPSGQAQARGRFPSGHGGTAPAPRAGPRG